MYIGKTIPWKAMKPYLGSIIGSRKNIKGVLAEKQLFKPKRLIFVKDEELLILESGKFLNEKPKNMSRISIKEIKGIKEGRFSGKVILTLQEDRKKEYLRCFNKEEARILLDILEKSKNKEKLFSKNTAKTRLMKIREDRPRAS